MNHKKWMAALAAGMLCVSFSSYANEGPDYEATEESGNGAVTVSFAAAVKQNGKWGPLMGQER